MNKLLTLVNLEIKRNKRFFVFYICLFSLLTLALNIIQINKLSKRTNIVNSVKESFGGMSYGMGVINANIGLSMLITVSIVGILIYTVYMWSREYNGSSKSIYTLMMLPNDKYIIYLSKMISTITMVYTMIISQITMIYISKFIFNNKFKEIFIKSSLKSDLQYTNDFLKQIIPTNMIDFFMTYIILLVLVISILFTVYIIGLSFKDDTQNMPWLIFIVAFLMGDIVNFRLSEKLYLALASNTIGAIGVDFVLNILVIIVLNIVSHYLINKRLYI